MARFGMEGYQDISDVVGSPARDGAQVYMVHYMPGRSALDHPKSPGAVSMHHGVWRNQGADIPQNNRIPQSNWGRNEAVVVSDIPSVTQVAVGQDLLQRSQDARSSESVVISDIPDNRNAGRIMVSNQNPVAGQIVSNIPMVSEATDREPLPGSIPVMRVKLGQPLVISNIQIPRPPLDNAVTTTAAQTSHNDQSISTPLTDSWAKEKSGVSGLDSSGVVSSDLARRPSAPVIHQDPIYSIPIKSRGILKIRPNVVTQNTGVAAASNEQGISLDSDPDYIYPDLPPKTGI